MIDPEDNGDLIIGGIAAVLVLLVILEPRQVGYLLVGGAVVWLFSELSEERTDPVVELLEEPRVEPEESLIGGRIEEIVTPEDYGEIEMTESLAARLDGEAILVLEDDDATIIDELLETVGLGSTSTTVLVDRETASVLEEDQTVAIESQQVTVPLEGIWEASSDVDLDPTIGEQTETSEAVHEVTIEEASSNGDLEELFGDDDRDMPVVRSR